ncbi:MAG TPA: hypothetical protein H9717_03970 [Candidatus Eisenbergiella merdipullorum]|uniref:DUF5716 domain-containing protein n=1 Tax=Candidatus Eisenbergiella merdipullorum TaxID=2838553 RepID=A0A9D2I3U3_9FIRM|nr:hypothetical protein [Candidatus Eisenbergiella merdipullorum]
MFLGNSEKKGIQGGILGMDLDDRFAQISYWLPGEKKPETLPAQNGGEDSMIPAVLCRRTDRDVWTYGKEALETAGSQEGVLVDRLLSRALSQEKVEAGGEIFEATALLALFIKRSLSLLGGLLRPEKAEFFMFTLEKVDRQALEMVERIAFLLSLPPERVSCQSRAESFFYYNINQPEELWRHLCLVCDFSGRTLKTLMFEADPHTRPVTVTVREEEHPAVERRLPAMEQSIPGDGGQEAELSEERKEKLDEAFASSFQQLSAGKIIDTIYLIGDGFGGDWYRKSLSLLCRNRRVFQGNNLYSKGACYGGKAKSPSQGTAAREYVYLGGDMLKVNLGLEAMRRGEEAYFALLDAGMNWFDARGECDFLLDADRTFSLRLTPVSGRKAREVIVTLDGIPDRPPHTTRIHLTASCPDEETVKLRMEDKGFGDFYPSSGLAWEESFPLVHMLED